VAPFVLGFYGLQAAVWGVLVAAEREHSDIGIFGSPLSSAWDHRLTALGLLVLGGLHFASAWGFWAGRLWARSLVVGSLATVTLVVFFGVARTMGPVPAGFQALPLAVLTALLWAYLYEARSAAAYYAELEEAEEEARKYAEARRDPGA
jgi:ABC-type xylose transport system permease subunit